MAQTVNKDDEYQELLVKIRKKRVLNIHIPGSGCLATDEIPTYQATTAATEAADTAAIYLEGVAGDAAAAKNKHNYTQIPPCQRNTSKLTSEKKSITRMLGDLITNPLMALFTGEVDFSTYAALHDKLAEAVATVFGTGEHQNTELVLNTLNTLDEDDCLPKEIILSGHSRGAINCIKLANKIYQKYGHKICVHLCLTDPVPGPFQWGDWEKRVIPPNVNTFTAFYAVREDNIFLTPHDLSRLVFTNPETTVTSYGTSYDHITILDCENITQALTRLISALNGRPILTWRNRFDNIREVRDPNALREYTAKNFSRIDCVYDRATAINRGLRLQIQSALQDIRKGFEHLYKPKRLFREEPQSYDDTRTELQRRRELKNCYDTAKPTEINGNELIAILLILPTLGFSATLYNNKAMAATSHKIAATLLSLLTLNLTASLYRLGATGSKLVYNISQGGFFNPPQVKAGNKAGEKTRIFMPEQKKLMLSEDNKLSIINNP